MKTLGDRIRDARTAKGMTQQAVADHFDIKRVNVTQWEGNTTRPDPKKLAELPNLLGGSVDWYLTGKGSAPDALIHILDEKSPALPKDGIVSLDIRAGLGGGGALSVSPDNGGIEEVSDGLWTMPDRVQAMFRNIGRTYAMPVSGDSMEPTLRGGSFVFVDTTITHPRDSDLYACDMGDGLVIKRLELIPKSENIWVKSDNESYRDYELRREDVLVYGRVVAHFQWRG